MNIAQRQSRCLRMPNRSLTRKRCRLQIRSTGVKIKNTAMLSTVSEIYENAGELGKARDTLFIAYDKAPSSRKVDTPPGNYFSEAGTFR